MKLCTKCKKYKLRTEFNRVSAYRLTSWCKKCIRKKNLEESMDKIIKAADKQAKKDKVIIDRWEEAKKCNEVLCKKRTEKYKKLLEKAKDLPEELYRCIKEGKRKPCIVCGERKGTYPYKIKDYIWLCKDHKPKVLGGKDE